MEDKLSALPFMLLAISNVISFFILGFRIGRIERKSEKEKRMDDSISRRMAIDAIQKDRETSWKDLENDDVEYKNGCDDGYAYSMQIISELPSVERKTGKWIKDEEKSADHVEPIFICSSCHNYEAWGLTECTRYCPNCGARMEEK